MHGSNNSYAVMIEQCYGKRENICSKNMNKFYVKYYPGLNILALYMYTQLLLTQLYSIGHLVCDLCKYEAVYLKQNFWSNFSCKPYRLVGLLCTGVSICLIKFRVRINSMENLSFSKGKCNMVWIFSFKSLIILCQVKKAAALLIMGYQNMQSLM